MTQSTTKTNVYEAMTEEEFAKELKQSLVILTTSSPDKRDIYRQYFSSHAKGDDHYAGVNCFFTDSGKFGLAPRKTAEMTNDYQGNLDEKARQQMETLCDPSEREKIRSRLMLGKNNEFDPETVNIVGMTEDSGWSLKFEDKEIEKQFIAKIKESVSPKLRERDQWLLGKLDKNGFPGPNLKPLQEHLEGGFDALMKEIYKAAEALAIKELLYVSRTNVCFVSPKSGKYLSKQFTHEGRMLTQEEYTKRLLGIQRGEAINSNYVHVPDGQENGEQKTLDILIHEGLYHKSSADLPAQYGRREMAEWLQGLVGKRRSSRRERQRGVDVAFTTPTKMHGKKSVLNTGLPDINDLKIVKLPAQSELRGHPNLKPFDDADAIVLIPNDVMREGNAMRSDANYAMLLNFVVTAETDPESMNVPVIVDNRSGKFNESLELISDAFWSGRLMGDTPFLVANTDEQMHDHLKLIKDLKQRAPIIRKPRVDAEHENSEPLPDFVPRDGVFTLFIGGGHANNSARDLCDAQELGYYCAQQGWRIVTGAGSVEGSMGAVHTGFVQYHLDQLQQQDGHEVLKEKLAGYIDTNGKYDAESIILREPELVEELADKKIIPRGMFYGYSLKPLLEMESPSGDAPPGITYFEAGNRVRRLDNLLAPGTKVFMPGSVGTDEEFEETVRQHLEARQRKLEHGVANDSAFADGTPDEAGMMIIYNRSGHLNRLLEHYHLEDNLTGRANRSMYNVVVIDTDRTVNAAEAMGRLKAALAGRAETAETWLSRIREEAPSVPDTHVAI